MQKNVAVRCKEVARGRVLDAARLLFTENGFHQTAMADLARKADVSVGTIYRSFASKTDIIHAIIDDDTRKVLGDLEYQAERLRNGTISAQEAVERIIAKRLADGDDALSHEILAEGHRNPAVAETLSTFCQELGDILRGIILFANPSLGGDRLEAAVELLQACLFGIGHHSLTQPEADGQATARIVAQLFMDTVG